MATGVEVILGSAEVHLFSADGVIYSSPDLVYHYVECHGYKPPSDYVEAVMAPRLNRELLGRLHGALVGAGGMGDRIDAALDLMVIAPDEAWKHILGADLESLAKLYLEAKLELVGRRLGGEWMG